jgi:hypothetical protein
VTYWVSLATHRARFRTLEAVLAHVRWFDPEPERVLVAVDQRDREGLLRILQPLATIDYDWGRATLALGPGTVGFVSVLAVACPGPGKKAWAALALAEALDGEPDFLLTVDDDCFYHPSLPRVLLAGAAEYPRSAVCVTGWDILDTRWNAEAGRWDARMCCMTAGPCTGPNGAAGVLYPRGALDWRRVRALSLARDTWHSDDVFLASEARRNAFAMVAVGNLAKPFIKPAETEHGHDQTALYRQAGAEARLEDALVACGVLRRLPAAEADASG